MHKKFKVCMFLTISSLSLGVVFSFVEVLKDAGLFLMFFSFLAAVASLNLAVDKL